MTVSKKIVLGVLSVVMALCLAMVFVPETLKADAEEENGFHINFSEVDMEQYSRITDVVELADGKFILSASEASSMGVDGNAKNSTDGKSFSQRLKLEGKRSGMDRTVSFFLEQKAKITVYAYSASSSDSTRKLNLYKNGTNGTIEDGAIMQSPAVRADGSIEPFTWETTEAGSYYISSAKDGVNIYYIGVEYTGAAEPITRKAWSEVTDPAIVGEPQAVDDNVNIEVSFTGVVGNDGADYALVHMYKMENGVQGQEVTRRYLAYGESGSVKFKPEASGTYRFMVELVRNGEVSKKSGTADLTFTYNLYQPRLRAMTAFNPEQADLPEAERDLGILLTIVQSKEADYYTVNWNKVGSAEKLGPQQVTADPATAEINYFIPDVELDAQYEVSVSATRNATSETTAEAKITVHVRTEAERDWEFRYFGTSTKEAYNYMDMGGNIYEGLTMHSCTYNESNDEISGQGGKFTYGGFDGISYYFTKIKASEEDFVLKSKITVNYINGKGNGQEGFALLVRDSIGENGSTDPFYTNSVAAISTKVQQRVGTANLTVTPGIGARFVTGVTTPSSGSTALQKMYLFDKTFKVSKFTEVIFEVKKVNNTYSASYYSLSNPEECLSKKTLYHTEYEDDGDPTNDTEYDPLCQIDKEYVYVGFAVARGCVATFTDITFNTTPRSQEYIEIVPEPITAASSIASPTTSALPQYKFSFTANSNGVVNVYLNDDDNTRDEAKLVIKDQQIEADVYFETFITLTEENNKFTAYFMPEPGWKTKYGEALDFYDEQNAEKYVTFKTFGEPTQALIVAPSQTGTITDSPTGVWGSPAGTGALNDPLDLQTALNYVLPGQTIYMLEGNYVNTSANYTVEKGNDGEADNFKTLCAHPNSKTRPVLNFKTAGAGFTLWGSYWHFRGFDITRTADGKKGLQVGGHYCLIEDINAYENGDSGIQVSGKSTDLPQFWPSYNLVLNCTSYSNADRAQEDADGFGAKLYCGKGNVFKGCLAYCNADDGWDLYAKTESGSIGSVLIENCITFGNGFNYDGSATAGNGNGFKLGGENLTGHHVIRNSISIANKMKGIDSNSCPDIEVYNCTSIYNSKYNYAFYTSEGVNPQTSFKAANNLSLYGISNDNISQSQIDGEDYVLKSDNNYFYYSENAFSNGLPAGSYNRSGSVLDYTKLVGWKNVDTTPDDDSDDNIYAYLGVEIDGSGAKGVLKRGNFEKIRNLIYREADGSLAIKDNYFAFEDETVTSGAKLQKTAGTYVGVLEWTFKDEEEKDVNLQFGAGINDEPNYRQPTEGNAYPDFEHNSTSSGGNSSTGSASGSSDGENQNGGSLTWLYVLIGVAVAAGIAAAVYFLVIKKKDNGNTATDSTANTENSDNKDNTGNGGNA